MTRFISTNGIRLHVVEAGHADGEPVVLLHGFPEFWYGWRHQITGLADLGFHVIAPDQRGYNLSDKPEGVESYRIEILAADIIGLMDELGYHHVNLGGHDWGAAVAWQVAMTVPERVKQLAILNVPHPEVMRRFLLKSWRQRIKSWYIFFFQLPRIPEGVLQLRGFAGLFRMMHASGAEKNFTTGDWITYRDAWQQPGALTAMISWYRAAFTTGRRSILWQDPVLSRKVTPRTMIIWGKNDIALRSEMAEASLDYCENGRLIFYQDSSHWVQHDKAAAVTRDLADFFRGNLP